MQNNNDQNRMAYYQELDDFCMRHRRKQQPKEIIATAVQQKTGIKDSAKVDIIAEKIIKGDIGSNYDLSLFDIAEAIEGAKAGVANQKEHLNWISETKSIINNMNDGMITRADLEQRRQFLDRSRQRDTDMLVCLALYEKSDNPLARQRYDEMLLKLKRLRQLRSLIFLSTKTRQEVKAEWKKRFKLWRKERYQSAKLEIVQQILQEMAKDEEGKSADVSEKLRLLHLSHENDAEFLKNYSFYTRMLEEQYRGNEVSDVSQKNCAAYLEQLRHNRDTKKDIQNRILMLSGRIDASNNYRIERRKFFDAERFRLLSELRNSHHL